MKRADIKYALESKLIDEDVTYDNELMEHLVDWIEDNFTAKGEL